MSISWKEIIKPCLDMAGVKKILIIGDPEELIPCACNYVLENKGKVYLASNVISQHCDLSIIQSACESTSESPFIVLRTITDYDALIIDGEKNWYSVYTCLQLVKQNKTTFPLVFIMNIDWPYDRRDEYENLDCIPPDFVNAYRCAGIDPVTNDLSLNGFNQGSNHSIGYKNYRCGVLTAVEDFIKEQDEQYKLVKIPVIGGLGILLQENQAASKEIDGIINLDLFMSLFLDVEKKYGLLHAQYEGAKKEVTYFEAKNSQNEELIQRQKTQLLEIQNALDELRAMNSSQLTEIEKVKSELAAQKILSKQYATEAKKHLTSIHYRIGEAFIAASHSCVDFIKLPVRLFRLYAEGKKKNKSSKSVNAQRLSIGKAYIEKLSKKDNKNKKKNKEDKVAKNNIIFENKKRINFFTGKESPLVSVIILNHNGENHLRTLLNSLCKTKFYQNYEILVIDNNSSDNSINVLKNSTLTSKITVIRNDKNVSFSQGCNQGAINAHGELLLFMNNDIEVTDGWLDELLIAFYSGKKTGAVGAKLVYPQISNKSINSDKSFTIQHSGIGFKKELFNEHVFYKPYNLGNGKAIFSNDEKISKVAAVTAATLLVSKIAFEDVGGFDEDYIYGYEDVDLCLKLYRKGYSNYYNPASLLFHYEFGSQQFNLKKDIVKRRTDNIIHFQEKWNDYLRKEILNDKIKCEKVFSEQGLIIAFAVTEAGCNVSAGDYFTALEFGTSLEKKGHSIKFLCRKGPADWYDIGLEVDVVISMLQSYNIREMYDADPNVITVAWARNWFDKWGEASFINDFSIVLSSCEIGKEVIKSFCNKDVFVFPIATNPDRFLSQIAQDENESDREIYGSDYVFTGSYWNSPREIISYLNPSDIDYKFKVFGENWGQISKFAPFWGGFVQYENVPKIYKYTKLVIDDANTATKEYGAVNSRVFDALGAGRLVVTNGIRGAEGIFNGLLPTFDDEATLKKQIESYLADDQMRSLKVKELQRFVLENHTYDIRADQFISILKNNLEAKEKKLAIMVPVPNWLEANSWGDYHFAIAMQKCFRSAGWSTEIRILPDWDKPFDGGVVICLRGLSRYNPRNEHINIMWNISHPDAVTIQEYSEYDGVFIASTKWAEEIAKQISIPCFPLLQCSDEDVFTADKSRKYPEELLFVGNSRKVFRSIIKDLLPTQNHLSIYGKDWNEFVDSKYIKGEFIDNNELGQHYKDCEILLNDHWDDMKEKGFLSNRLFDALCVGAFVISDQVNGLEDVFNGCIATYNGREDLASKIDYYLNNPEERSQMASRGQELVRSRHLFKHRMSEIMKFIEEIQCSRRN